jgi:hypothetical protein
MPTKDITPPPVPVVGSFAYRLVIVTSPLNLSLRTVLMVCLYAAVVHDAQMYRTWYTAVTPTTFPQAVFYISCLANGWLAVGYPLLRYFAHTPCLAWEDRILYDVNAVVSVTLFGVLLDAGAAGVFLTHMASIACTYIAFQVATICAIVWRGHCADDEGSGVHPADSPPTALSPLISKTTAHNADLVSDARLLQPTHHVCLDIPAP